MDWLQNLVTWLTPGGMSSQQAKPGVDPQGGASIPQTAQQRQGDPVSDAGRGAGKPGAMTNDFAKILAAQLLTQPALTYPRQGETPKINPFVYAAQSAAPQGPRMSLGRM